MRRAFKNIVELKFNHKVYCTGKLDYHTVIPDMTSFNLFVVHETDCLDWKK